MKKKIFIPVEKPKIRKTTAKPGTKFVPKKGTYKRKKNNYED